MYPTPPNSTRTYTRFPHATLFRSWVTHSWFVPTMFIRLLRLPPDVRAAADLSSLRQAIHSAAPCPVDVKAAMIEWFGPRLYDFYAARSEEHTSELQSLMRNSYAVFCLKKTNTMNKSKTIDKC